ncbi:MAG: CHASE2 domain-containing protein [Opitutaceae bacterium]
MRRVPHIFLYALLVISSITLWSILHVSTQLDGLEQEALRWRYLVRGPLPSTAPIIYVDLDAQTVASVGDKPWDRLNFAVLLHALLGPGEAKAVGLDVIFSQLGRGSLLDVERANSGDLAFGKAVKKYADQVVLAAAYTGTTGVQAVPLIRLGFEDPMQNTFPESPSFPIIDWQVGRLGLANVDEGLGRSSVPYWVVGFVEVEGEMYSRVLMGGMRNYFYDLLNQPHIVEDADTFTLTDKDGWSPQQIPRNSSQTLYSIGLELFMTAEGLSHAEVEKEQDALILRKDGDIFRRIPLTEQQSIEVNWFEGWKAHSSAEHVSMREVLERASELSRAAKEDDAKAVAREESWFQQFKDKVVFVGPTDPQLKDIAPTPYNREPVPKVGMHANLYRTVQEEAYVKRFGAFVSVLITVGLTVLVAFFTLWGGFGRSFLKFGSVCAVFGYVAAAFLVFAQWNWVLPFAAPVGASTTAALGLMLVKLGAEEWERRRIKSMFGAYVSPDLVNQLVDSKREPELGGVEAEITALFSDVEGFTNLAEQLPANDLVRLMNEYLSAMTEAVQIEGGTLDKYIGDAIVTMFGMPVPIKDHAARACLAAQRMQVRHAELRQKWAVEGVWPKMIVAMRTRIGVNTGEAVIGNMGSQVRFNYTMMGDSVNLAARCESGAKAYGVYTMVTDATLFQAQKVVPDLPVRKLDRIIVKGRTVPVEVYELWDESMDLDVANNCKQAYEMGLEYYFKGEWTNALRYFESAEQLEPHRLFALTTPSKIMIDRCRWYILEGAPADWDGVYRMQAK